MPKFIGMDQRVTLADQLRSEEGPVVLIDTSVIPPEYAGRFMTSWRADAAIMEARSGSISTQLHRGIAGGGAFLNDAVRQSAAHFRAAFADPEFQRDRLDTREARR